jgi:hypothetical protein
MSGWRALTGSLDEWQPAIAEFSYTTVDTRTQSSGRYIVPTAALDLPAEYELRTRVRFEAASTSPAVNLLTDFGAPQVTQNNLTAQVNGAGSIAVARPNTRPVCSGRIPVVANTWHDLVVRRSANISVVEIDGQRVAAVDSPAAGGTVGLGVYHAKASFASVVVHELVEAPDDHPSAATRLRLGRARHPGRGPAGAGEPERLRPGPAEALHRAEGGRRRDLHDHRRGRADPVHRHGARPGR